jgi:8-oxo-dGTP diphosphatase
MPTRFTIRVYGILQNENQEILVSDEWIRGLKITKFPGGGLEFGEGTRDCLAREFLEEMNLRIETLDHFYTTDFFQESAFDPGRQVLSVYYRVKPLEPITAPIKTIPFDFGPEQLAVYEKNGETACFRFIPFDIFSPEAVSLPIDKVVAQLLKK